MSSRLFFILSTLLASQGISAGSAGVDVASNDDQPGSTEQAAGPMANSEEQAPDPDSGTDDAVFRLPEIMVEGKKLLRPLR